MITQLKVLLYFILEKKTKKYLVSKSFLYLTGQLGSCWFNVSTKGVKPLFNLALEFEAQNAGLFCVFHILNCRNPDGVCHTYGSNQSCMPGIRQILRRQFVVKPSRVTLVCKSNPTFILKYKFYYKFG